MKKNNKNGFTLIELIMVMIILGILSAVAIPRYLETIQKSEVSAEDAVISKLCAALENYAQHKMLTEGRRFWPENPFEALETLPQTYTDDGVNADTDNESRELFSLVTTPYSDVLRIQELLSVFGEKGIESWLTIRAKSLLE